MRLIDADALKKSMRKSINERYISWTKTITVADIATLIFDEIEYAPTVEGEIELLTKEAYSDLCLRASKERPKGEWITEDVVKPYGICNRCGVICEVDNFCGNCGAYMIKEANNE